MIKTLSDLDIFKMSYEIAMDIFQMTRIFPKEEKYSLIDQVIRSSRSVSANIAEGWGKRTYENDFKRHLVYSMGSLEETKIWLLFARDCQYIDETRYSELMQKMNKLGGKIYKLYENWKKV
jgi:four helix bundle protein